MSDVDDISQGLSREMRGVYAAALALAQLTAQRRAAQVRAQAAQTGVTEREARRRFEVEQRTTALGIALPESGMSPEQLATSWAQADVARAHAPEVAQFWDARARAAGVDPEQVRAQWWREQGAARQENPSAYQAAVNGLGREGTGLVADADRTRAEDLQAAADQERREGDTEIDHQRDAEAEADRSPDGSPAHEEATASAHVAQDAAEHHLDRADTFDKHSEDVKATAAHQPSTETELGAPPASPGAWQQGHPSARLAGQAYGVPPGRGAAAGRRPSRGGGRGLSTAKQREHGLDR